MLLGDPLNLFGSDDDDDFGLDDILFDSNTDSVCDTDSDGVDLPYLELKRRRLSSARSYAGDVLKCTENSHEDESMNGSSLPCDGQGVDFEVSKGGRISTEQRKSVGGASSSGERPVKRSRASLRDVQLGKAVSDSSMQVAERAADLRDATAVKVCDRQIASRVRMLAVVERIAVDWEMQMEEQRDAMKVHKDAIKRADEARAVFEMTNLYVAGGMKPGEAKRKQAILDVSGPEADL
jgi:hypothetical protein